MTIALSRSFGFESDGFVTFRDTQLGVKSRFRCTSCDEPLSFIDALVSAESPVEQVDRYICRRCDMDYEYRHRTHTLKRSSFRIRRPLGSD